jgi:hypothetical protein
VWPPFPARAAVHDLLVQTRLLHGRACTAARSMSNAAQIELGSMVSLWRYPVKAPGTRPVVELFDGCGGTTETFAGLLLGGHV